MLNFGICTIGAEHFIQIGTLSEGFLLVGGTTADYLNVGLATRLLLIQIFEIAVWWVKLLAILIGIKGCESTTEVEVHFLNCLKELRHFYHFIRSGSCGPKSILILIWPNLGFTTWNRILKKELIHFWFYWSIIIYIYLL